METISENETAAAAGSGEEYAYPETSYRKTLVKPTKKNRARRASTGGILKARPDNSLSPQQSKKQAQEEASQPPKGNRRKSVQFGNIHTRLYDSEVNRKKYKESPSMDLPPVALGEHDDDFLESAHGFPSNSLSLSDIMESYEDDDSHVLETESNSSTMDITGNLPNGINEIVQAPSLQDLINYESDDSEDELLDNSQEHVQAVQSNMDHDQTIQISAGDKVQVDEPENSKNSYGFQEQQQKSVSNGTSNNEETEEFDITMQMDEHVQNMFALLNGEEDYATETLPDLKSLDSKTQEHFQQILGQVDPSMEDDGNTTIDTEDFTQHSKKSIASSIPENRLSANQVLKIASISAVTETFRRKSNSLIMPLSDHGLSQEEAEENRSRQWFIDYPKYNTLMKGEEAMREKIKETLNRIAEIERALYNSQPEMFKVAQMFVGKDSDFQAPEGPFVYVNEFQDYMRDLHELVLKSARTVRFQLKTAIFQNYYFPCLTDNISMLQADLDQLKRFESRVLTTLREKKEDASLRMQFLREQTKFALIEAVDLESDRNRAKQSCVELNTRMESLMLKKQGLKDTSRSFSQKQLSDEETQSSWNVLKDELAILESSVGWVISGLEQLSSGAVQLSFSFISLPKASLKVHLSPGNPSAEIVLENVEYPVLEHMFATHSLRVNSVAQLRVQLAHLECELYRLRDLGEEIAGIKKRQSCLTSFESGQLILKVYFVTGSSSSVMVRFQVDRGYPFNEMVCEMHAQRDLGISEGMLQDIVSQTTGFDRIQRICSRIESFCSQA